MYRRRAATWFLSIVSVLSMLVAQLLPVGAAASKGGDAPLRIQQRYYPDSFDPQASSGIEFSAFLGANYEGLTRLDQHLNVVPAAAESWDVSADGSVLTFHLREGLTYSDGSPLSASRFVDAVQRACDPTVLGDYQHILFDIVGCQEFAYLNSAGKNGSPGPDIDETAFQTARTQVGVWAIDDRTLEVQLTHAAPYFPAIASLPIMYPAKRELIDQGGETWWQNPLLQVGNGPFQVVRIEPDQLIEFRANDRYWGGRPRLDGLEFVYLTDSSVALEAYQAGDLDIVSIDSDLLAAAGEDSQLSNELIRIPAASTGFLSFNLTREPFSDKKVREALAYAFDRQTYCELLRDGGCIAALSWIPSDVPGSIVTDAYAFNPTRARQALAASSYGGPDRLPEITFAYWVEDPLAADWAEWVAGQYRDTLGVAITLQPLDGKTLVAQMSDPSTYPSIGHEGWVQDYPDPQNWLSVFWRCDASYARSFGYCNPVFDSVTAQADQELDPVRRLSLYESASQILIDDAPGVFLSNGVFLYLVKPEIEGYEPTAVDAAWPGQTASQVTITAGG